MPNVKSCSDLSIKDINGLPTLAGNKYTGSELTWNLCHRGGGPALLCDGNLPGHDGRDGKVRGPMALLGLGASLGRLRFLVLSRHGVLRDQHDVAVTSSNNKSQDKSVQSRSIIETTSKFNLRSSEVLS